jgi:hypothetical protein
VEQAASCVMSLFLCLISPCERTKFMISQETEHSPFLPKSAQIQIEKKCSNNNNNNNNVPQNVESNEITSFFKLYIFSCNFFLVA